MTRQQYEREFGPDVMVLGPQDLFFFFLIQMRKDYILFLKLTEFASLQSTTHTDSNLFIYSSKPALLLAMHLHQALHVAILNLY